MNKMKTELKISKTTKLSNKELNPLPVSHIRNKDNFLNLDAKTEKNKYTGLFQSTAQTNIQQYNKNALNKVNTSVNNYSNLSNFNNLSNNASSVSFYNKSVKLDALKRKSGNANVNPNPNASGNANTNLNNTTSTNDKHYEQNKIINLQKLSPLMNRNDSKVKGFNSSNPNILSSVQSASYLRNEDKGDSQFTTTNKRMFIKHNILENEKNISKENLNEDPKLNTRNDNSPYKLIQTNTDTKDNSVYNVSLKKYSSETYIANKDFNKNNIETPEDLHFFYVRTIQQNKSLIYKFDKEDV